MHEEHPHLLAWYVAGSLTGEPAREVEVHLERCRRCRREAHDLGSIRDVVLATRSDHVPAEALVDYESGGELPSAERDAIERHLERCEDCREDLASLSRARETAPAAVAPLATSTGPAGRRAWLAAAAGLALLLGVPASLWVLQRFPDGELVTARRIVLLPGTRGAEQVELPTGTGAWSMEVGLPWGAPAGPYDVRIETAGGQPLPGTDTRAVADEDATLILVLRSPPGPGLYVLRAEPAAGNRGAGPFLYPFAVVLSTGPPGGGEPEGTDAP